MRTGKESVIMSFKFQYYGTKVNDITPKGFVTLQEFAELQMATNTKQLFEKKYSYFFNK
jgi:hypothetical protein